MLRPSAAGGGALLCALLLAGLARAEEDAFAAFLARFGKDYAGGAAYEAHRAAFEDSRIFVEGHASPSFSVGLNHLSDLTEGERGRLFWPLNGSAFHETAGQQDAPRLCLASCEAGSARESWSLFPARFPGPSSRRPEGAERDAKAVLESLPDSVDWSSKRNPLRRSVVTPVRNQGQCGSCWAWVAAGTVEASVAIDDKNLVALSAQQLLDCDHAQNMGCSGGNPLLSYPYIIENGLAADASYPYRGEEGACRSAAGGETYGAGASGKVAPVSTITGYGVVKQFDEQALMAAVSVGPVAVGVCGSALSFLLYSGGVYDDAQCGAELNHALLLVGYGRDEELGVDYWLAKNSWGSEWGEDGMMRLFRGASKASDGAASPLGPEGVCGITLAASLAIGGFGGNTTGIATPAKGLFDAAAERFAELMRRLPPWCAQLLAAVLGALCVVSVFQICEDGRRRAGYERIGAGGRRGAAPAPTATLNV